MNHYDIAILGNDPLALPLAKRLSQVFPRVLWLVEDSAPQLAPLVGIERLQGDFQFLDEHSIVLSTPEGSQIITAEQIVIATGSSPRRAGWMIEHPQVLFAEQWQQISPVAEQVAVVGLGSRGAEICGKLQGRVKTIQCLDANSIHWNKQNLLLTGGTSSWLSPNNAVIGLAATQTHLKIYLENGDFLNTDAIVICCGYYGNTATLALDAAGLSCDDRGRIWCNESYETWTTGIFAIGSVVGFPREEKPVSTQLDIVCSALTTRETQTALQWN